MNPTHEVFNQPEPLVDVNLFDGNRALQAALAFNAPGLDTAALSALGERVGSAEMQTHARLANVNAPVLHSHDRFGRRIDQVEFHPSWHALLALYRAQGLVAQPFRDAQSGRWSAWAAGFYLHGQIEQGSLCPATMTSASIISASKSTAGGSPPRWPAT